MSDREARLEAVLAERLERPRGIPKAPPGPVPLSPVQQSLWVRSQVLPDEPENARPLHLRLRGCLSLAALAEALARLVERHEVLRTTYPLIDDEPCQVVGDVPRFELYPTDLSASADPEAAAHEACRQHALTRFDLTREVPFRPHLLRLAADDHVLTVAMSHIVFDGWSERRFLDELAALYDSALTGEPSGLEPLTHQVRDHAAWVRERLEAEDEEAHLRWWMDRLSDLPPDTQLPADRPPFEDDADPVAAIDLGPETTDALRRLAASHDATLFMVMLAGLQVLLFRLTGQHDVAITFPSAGRNRPEIEPLIGCFIDTAVLRSQVDADRSFVDALRETRRGLLEAMEHRVPFSRVLAAVRPWDGRPRVPLSRVYAQFRNFPGEVRSSEHLDIAHFGPPALGSANLSVSGDVIDGSLRIKVRYDRGRFRRASILRHLDSLAAILRAASQGDARAIGDLDIIDPVDRGLLEGGWDGPAHPAPPPLPADVIREAAGRFSDLTALEWGDRSLTYGEFDTRIDRMASALVARGLGPERPVVLFLERGPDAATAVVAALRARVPFVPVDRSLTAEWLGEVIAQTEPGLVVTDGEPSGVPAGWQARTVDDLVDEGDGRLHDSPRRTDLAYVLYTSGSTGAPKGVMVDQGNLAAYVAAQSDIEDVSPDDRIMWFHSMSFDAVFKTIFLALGKGATLIERDSDAVGSIQRLFSFYGDNGVTRYWGPTSFARVIMEEAVRLDAELPERLRIISFGGEQLRADVLEAFVGRFGDRVRLLNSYGPTESTVSVTSWFAPSGQARFDWAPIGRPITGVAVRVVDERGGTCPIGVFGELLVGGDQVARGYLGAPELTRLRFFTDDAGVRWYRSGDLGRWLDGGTLEVVGRTDRQVKVRGYRVEPAEIESVLHAVDGVRDAATVVAEGADGDTVIHAYAETELTTGELRRLLDGALPSFLMPATITTVGTFPRTPGEKVDVRRLPAPGSAADADAPPAQDPGVVERVRAVWAEVLGVDRVEGSDGFFTLGGHSLLAIRLVSRIGDQLGVSLSLESVFSSPTFSDFVQLVNDQAREVSTRAHGEATPSPPAIEPVAAHPAPSDGRGSVIAAVRAVWEEVLGVPVHDEDGFFALGGHSLLAIRLVGRINERLDARVTLETVFSTPTFGDFAAVVVGDTPSGSGVTEPGGPEFAPSPPVAPSIDEVLAEIESLSEAEVERLLAELEAGV